MNGEKNLWRAVILQAFQDMAIKVNLPADTKEKQRRNVRKLLAVHWLTHHSKHLHHVCEYADMHPDDVIKTAKRFAGENGINWRAKPGKGKHFAKSKRYRLKVRRRCNPSVPFSGLPEPAPTGVSCSLTVEA